jgi:hypothetical protein
MRSARVRALLPYLLPALAVACHRRASQAQSSPDGTAALVTTAVDQARYLSDSAGFSAPIAATRAGHADVVAGLIVASRALRVIGLPPDGTAWTVDALHGVAWAPDAEVRLQPAADGVALFWRGLHDGKAVREIVWIGPRGELRGEPAEIGPTFCGTADGVAWIAPHAHGPTRVKARRWADAEPRDALTMAADRDPALVCGDRDVVAFGEGDDDLTAAVFSPGGPPAPPPIVVLRDADFGDEQREHEAFSVGDDFGLVRVGTSGAIAVRDLPHGAMPGQWRRLKHTLSEEDDVVLVDGDTAGTLIVVTRGADAGCAAGSMPESVRAIRIDRKTGEESVIELAPGDCDSSPGPFWLATGGAGSVVAWVERRTAIPGKAAPVVGVAFRVLRPDGVVSGRVEQAADAFVPGGCDERGCSLAALVREPLSDATRPAPIRVFTYP